MISILSEHFAAVMAAVILRVMKAHRFDRMLPLSQIGIQKCIFLFGQYWRHCVQPINLTEMAEKN